MDDVTYSDEDVTGSDDEDRSEVLLKVLNVDNEQDEEYSDSADKEESTSASDSQSAATGNSSISGSSSSSKVNDTKEPAPSKPVLKRVKCLPRTKPMFFKADKAAAIGLEAVTTGDGQHPEAEEHRQSEQEMTLTEKSRELIKEMEDLEPKVQLINGTYLLETLTDKFNPNVTNRSMPAECHLVMFYASWCPFSAQAAPHYNALARLYPDISLLAVDSSEGSSTGINTHFGILAIPTLILFHNTKPISKFNHTDYILDNFLEFVDTFTHSKVAASDLVVTAEDRQGPMPTRAVAVPDYYLLLAWLFTILCAVGYFAKSSYCQLIIESVRNNWREAEIQHEHID